MSSREKVAVIIDGRLVERPRREDFSSDASFVRAVHDYHRKIERASSMAFDESFRQAMQRKGKRR